jgi:transposase-like protein
MSEGNTGEAEVVRLRQSIETQMRRRILEAIEVVLEEELTEALGTGRYERGDARRGYRNGHQTRGVTTAVGAQTLEVPRRRILEPEGSSHEFRSQVLPRYARRTREVDEAILGAYLAGAKTRRIKKALAPLLGEKHLSKSAVSRVVARLKAQFAQWSERDLSQEHYAILFLDGFHLKVRMARQVVSVPVLAVLGVTEDGTKRLVALQLAQSEAGRHWSCLVGNLQRRGYGLPLWWSRTDTPVCARRSSSGLGPRSNAVRGTSGRTSRATARRTETQASFSSEEARVTLLWALVAFDQIQMRRIVGYRSVAGLLVEALEAAA